MLRLAFSISKLVLLLVFASVAQAQTERFVVVQDVQQNVADPCELASTGSLTINPTSGDISITVADLQSCLGSANALDVSEILTSPTIVEAGTSVTVVWASVGPEAEYSCSATPGGGNPLPGWVGTTIGLQGPTAVPVAVETASGLYDLGISCAIPGDVESTVTRSAQVQVTAASINPPPIPTLTVNGFSNSTSIEQGDTVTVLWSSQSATSCQASGTFTGWPGAKALSGNEVFSDTSAVPVGSYTISLRCSNLGGQSPLASVSLNVTDPDDPPPSECATRPLLGQGALNDWVRKTTGTNSCRWGPFGADSGADCRFFDQVWPSAWPSVTVRRDLFVDGSQGRQFIAMEFNSGNIPFDHEGRLTQEVPQFPATSAAKMWSISQCPGDFNKDILDAEMGPGCVREDEFGVTQSFDYGGPSSENVNAIRRCALQPNTRYFLNIVFTQDVAGTPPAEIEPHPTCVTTRCGVPITPSSIYTP